MCDDGRIQLNTPTRFISEFLFSQENLVAVLCGVVYIGINDKREWMKGRDEVYKYVISDKTYIK